MIRDAKLADMLKKLNDEDQLINEETKRKLNELNSKKNDKGEIILDYDEFDEE